MCRKFLYITLSLCVFLLSGCGGNDTPSSETAVTTAVCETTEAPPVTETSAEVTESETAADTTPTNTEFSSESAETEASIWETSSETESETTVAESETTTAETSPPTETTTSERITEPVEIVIPELKIPLSSGERVAVGDSAQIDFSSADEGYISAVYTGKSRRAKLRIRCGDLQYDHDLSADGTEEFFPLMTDGSYTVKVYEQVTGKSYAESVSAEFEVTLRSKTEMYLYPNKYVRFDKKSAAVKKAAELCAGKDGDVEKITAIFGYVSEKITYDKKLASTVTSGYVPDPDRTLSSGKGICFDYASLVAAMCRSQGIPTRLVIGYAEPEIYHAWNEIYTDETGWITPELFLKSKGFNLADATFYAGNPDKEKIAAYISDDSNYAAMYRY